MSSAPAKNQIDDAALGDLVHRAQRGDRMAMRNLILETQEPLFRFCRYLSGDEHLARDIAQQSMVKVLEHIKQIDKPTAFRSWLFKSAKNLYLDYIRAKGNSPKHDAIEDSENSLVSSRPGADVIAEINKALSVLPTEERAVVELVFREEMTYHEVAEALGITEDAVRWKLRKARELLEKAK